MKFCEKSLFDLFPPIKRFSLLFYYCHLARVKLLSRRAWHFPSKDIHVHVPNEFSDIYPCILCFSTNYSNCKHPSLCGKTGAANISCLPIDPLHYCVISPFLQKHIICDALRRREKRTESKKKIPEKITMFKTDCEWNSVCM